MKKISCLLLAALTGSALTVTAHADVIAEPAILSGTAGRWLLILLVVLAFVTLYIASKHGGKRK